MIARVEGKKWGACFKKQEKCCVGVTHCLHKALVLKKLGQFVKPELPVHFRLGGGFRFLEPYFHLIGTLCVLVIVFFYFPGANSYKLAGKNKIIAQDTSCCESLPDRPLCPSFPKKPANVFEHRYSPLKESPSKE